VRSSVFLRLALHLVHALKSYSTVNRHDREHEVALAAVQADAAAAAAKAASTAETASVEAEARENEARKLAEMISNSDAKLADRTNELEVGRLVCCYRWISLQESR
jgi:hypothetical protein